MRANVFRTEKLSKSNFAPTSRHGVEDNLFLILSTAIGEAARFRFYLKIIGI